MTKNYLKFKKYNPKPLLKYLNFRQLKYLTYRIFKYLDFKAFKASMVMSLLLSNELSQQHPDASSASVKYT